MATKKAAKKSKVEKVMHEFKEGDLRSSSGDKVKSRKQAVAIGLSEAREAGENMPPRKKAAKKSTGRKKTTTKKSTASKKTATKKKGTAKKSPARKKTAMKKSR